jgi:hypothetical protein
MANSPKEVSGDGGHRKEVHDDGVSTPSFGDGGGCRPGNLPTTAVGLRETPSGDIAVREMVQRQGVGGS